MASVNDWSQTPASNTSVGGISTDGAVTLVKQIDNMIRGLMSEVAISRDDGTIMKVGPRGYLHGLTLSNNAGDATNDIDIAVGECVTLDTPYWKMALASALTKRLDAAWAVGTGNGGLDTGAIANTTYHVWLIQRSDTLVVDALFSTSATAPTMPANYDRKRRIGSIIRESAAIVAFTQVGDVFRRAAFVSYQSTATYASQLTALQVPLGVIVQPILAGYIAPAASSNIYIALGSASAGSANIIPHQARTDAGGPTETRSFVNGGIFTDTSAQIYFQHNILSGTASTNTIVHTVGWIDTRGRVA